MWVTLSVFRKIFDPNNAWALTVSSMAIKMESFRNGNAGMMAMPPVSHVWVTLSAFRIIFDHDNAWALTVSCMAVKMESFRNCNAGMMALLPVLVKVWLWMQIIEMSMMALLC